MARLHRILGAPLVAALWVAGCGGNVAVDERGAAGSGGAGGKAPSACPAASPAVGAPCSGPTQCVYGNDTCKQSVECVSGHWTSGPVVCSTCPAATPTFGDPCSTEGASCTYTDPSCSEAGAQATCAKGLWDVVSFGPACAPSCPVTPPVDGAPCNACCDDFCSYLPTPGCAPVYATCDSGAWSISSEGCAPSPLGCLQHTTPVACANDVSCRWLEPGCSVNALPFEGCFNKAECTSDTQCGPGQVCWKGDYDPCWNMGCNACSATTFVCLPPPPP